MSYLSLARRYRPQTFEEIIGQEYVSTTLKNAVRDDKVVQGYLFCGPRGTAKTSSARILAKAMNCIGPDGNRTIPNPEPCGQCDPCKEIADSSFIDVVEIDAASHGKIDDIRDLISSIAFPPMAGRYKIYIIDEAHQLSKDAKDALLKTLEEPPAQVIFVLATTEVAKIPTTIASRCQTFQFQPGSEIQIAEHLKVVLAKEEGSADDESLELIARQAQGSYRDGLAILDRVIAFAGKNFDKESVLKSIGIPESELINRLFKAMVKTDRKEATWIALEVLKQGISGYGFAQQIGERLRDLLMVHVNPRKDTPEFTIKQANEFTYEQLSRAVRAFYFLKDRLVYGGYERVELELGVLNLIDAVQGEVNPYGVDTPDKPATSAKEPAMPRKIDQIEGVEYVGVAVNEILSISFDYPDYFPPSTAAKVIAGCIEKTKDDIKEMKPKVWESGLRRAALDSVRSLCHTCTRCELSKYRLPNRGSSFGEGVVDPLVMIVGEGPGEYEQRTGLPFIDSAALRVSTCATSCKNFEACFTADDKPNGPWSRTPSRDCDYEKIEIDKDLLEERLSPRKREVHTAGAVLSRALRAAGLRRSTRTVLVQKLQKLGKEIPKSELGQSNLYLTNAVRCRSVDSEGKNAAPTKEQIDTCRPWLEITERLVKPRVVLGLGKTGLTALEAKMGSSFSITKECPPSTKVAVKSIERKGGGEAFVSFHPSYILYKKDEEEVIQLEKKLTQVLTEVREIAENAQ